MLMDTPSHSSFTLCVVEVERKSSRLRPDPRIRVRQFGRDISIEGRDVAC